MNFQKDQHILSKLAEVRVCNQSNISSKYRIISRAYEIFGIKVK